MNPLKAKRAALPVDMRCCPPRTLAERLGLSNPPHRQLDAGAIMEAEAAAQGLSASELCALRGKFSALEGFIVRFARSRFPGNSLETASEEEVFRSVSQAFYGNPVVSPRYEGGVSLLDGLSGKGFNCRTASVVMGAALQELGRPAWAGVTEKHVFVLGKKGALETTSEETRFVGKRMLKRVYGKFEAMPLGYLSFLSVCHAAFALECAGRLDESLPFFDKAVEIDPSGRMRRMKAMALRDLGRAEEAIGCLDELAKNRRFAAEALGMKAGVLEMAGREKEAYACYGRILSLTRFARGEDALDWRGLALRAISKEAFDEGDSAKALKLLRAALKITPGDADTWAVAGMISYFEKDYLEAASCFSEACALEPGNQHYAAMRAESAKKYGAGI
jgi:tetratricopeptide (TPR) repeat protein